MLKTAEVTEKQLLCPHMNFAADVSVRRITNGEGGPVTSYMADVTVNCADCGQQFSFLGLPGGLNMAGAAISPDGHIAHLAIAPGVGGLFAPPVEPGGSGLMGFSITKGDK